MPTENDNDHIIQDLFKDKLKKQKPDLGLSTPRLPDELILIVDCSGSMSTIRTDAEGGINTFIEEQKNVEGDANLTLVEFDSDYHVIHEGVNLDTVEPYTLRPRGTTALLDAIGITISMFGENSGKKIVVVVTDGFENASIEYTRDMIFKMINERKENGWEFIFLAAGQDAMEVGSNYGFNPEETVNFAGSGDGVKAAYDTAAVYTTSIRGCEPKSVTLGKVKNFIDSNVDLS